MMGCFALDASKVLSLKGPAHFPIFDQARRGTGQETSMGKLGP